MSGITHFESFLLAGILLNLTPGNDTIFILSRSIAQGRKAGVMSAFGIAAGSLVHTSLAAFGLSVIIAKSQLLFQVVKYAGAVYMAWIGLKMLFDRSSLTFENGAEVPKQQLYKVFRDAFFTNILNPKVALFFIAFLPQFIEEGYKGTIPFFILGFTFIATGLTWCLCLAIFSAEISKRLRADQRLSSIIGKVCGGVLVALGVRLAVWDKWK